LNKWETPNIPVQKVEKTISTPTPKVTPTTPIQTETKTIETEATPTKVESTPVTPETTQVTKASTTPIDTSNIEKIKSQLIAKVTNNTTKHNIQDYVFIKWIEWNTITLIIINKIAEISLNKDMKEIEQVLTEIMWQPMVIQTQFQDKNEFFASQLL
jgi:hypothetical protein